MAGAWVLDACVAAKCFLDEPYSPHARALLASGAAFHVPDLFYVECAGILCRAVRKKGLPRGQADAALVELSAWPLAVTPARVLLAEAARIANAAGATAQDGCYVALAARLGVPLVTNDLKLIEPLRGTEHEPVWLGEWEKAARRPDCQSTAPAVS